MKFGKKRSPEPEPIDITERLSILDLRPSVREGVTTPVSAGIGTIQPAPRPAADAVPAPAPAEQAAVVVPAPLPPAPLPPAPLPSAPPVEQAAPAPAPATTLPETPAVPSVAEPAPVHSAPDPVAYELAAFELNVPVQAATAPVPSDVAHIPAEALPEPAVERIDPPAASAAPPAWSYEQVARIEHTEQHVSAWVPEQARPATTYEPATYEPPAYEPPAVEPAAAHEPPAAEPAAAYEHTMAAEAVDETPGTGEEPVLDLTEQAAPAEHDPVFAAVEAAQNSARDDDGVIRWHW